jgi:hypothetical protein
MAFTARDGLRHIVFATYRGTLKHQSLLEDGRVALLVDDENDDATQSGRRVVLTAIGQAAEVPEEERPAHAAAHLARHPDLEEFLDSPDCVFVLVVVGAYQVVGGIDDVQWYHLNDPAAT